MYLESIWRVVGAFGGLAARILTVVVRVVARLRDVFARVLESLGLARSSGDGIKQSFEGVASVVDVIADGVEAVTSAVDVLGAALEWVIEKLGDAADAAEPLLKKLKWVVDHHPAVMGFRAVRSALSGDAASSAVTGAISAEAARAAIPSPWEAQRPVTSTTYAPTFHVTSTQAQPEMVARELDKIFARKLRQAAAAAPR